MPLPQDKGPSADAHLSKRLKTRRERRPRAEWIRAGEQPGGKDFSKWGRNGRIEAQRVLAAAQVTPMATQKEAGRGKSI